jgi:hypothetical protein
MTLFVRTPKRLFEISDFYVMILVFLIFFSVGRICKAVIEKQTRANSENVDIANPRGGNFNLEFSDDTELGRTILSCIADNERYLVKNPKLINIIFNLAKAKLKNESLVLTPNLLRFLALKLINNDQTLVVKIGNIVTSADNTARLVSRIVGAALIGAVGAAVAPMSYSVLVLLLYFDATENCGYKCSDYFEQLPKEGPAKIYGEKSTGHIVIRGKEDAQQLEIYIPSQAAGEVRVGSNGEVKKTRTYTKVRKKAKQVKFADFKQTDPILSSFTDLEEPDVPQKICPLNEVHEIIDIQIE